MANITRLGGLNTGKRPRSTGTRARLLMCLARWVRPAANSMLRTCLGRIIGSNCGQLATELTNEQCSFWHFRLAGSVEMRAVARIKSLPASLETVYLLNQDYLFGQSIRNDTKKFRALYRPDIKIVGDEMIPLMQVKDFWPYITKIKASGSESLLTGNYGPDLALLIKAGVDAGLNIRYDSYLGHVIGAPTAISPPATAG
jgi:branched-chain amino acid transport system substrate-binding protein